MRAPPILRLAPGAAPPRVLIVDDHPTNRQILVRLLSKTGFTVREAENGEQAVALAEQWRPEAVLMDLQMPVLDGLAATRQIKQAQWGLSIAVIIVSGSGREASFAAALAAGALTFLGKPIVEAELLATLAAALQLVYG